MANDERSSTRGQQTGPEKDKKGLYVAGNKGGPGNPLASSVQRLRCVLFEEVGEDQFRTIIQKLYQQATVEGNVEAAREILNRLLGKPKETRDVTLNVRGILEEARDLARLARLTRQQAPALLPSSTMGGTKENGHARAQNKSDNGGHSP